MELLSTRAVAIELGVTAATMYRWMRLPGTPGPAMSRGSGRGFEHRWTYSQLGQWQAWVKTSRPKRGRPRKK